MVLDFPFEEKSMIAALAFIVLAQAVPAPTGTNTCTHEAWVTNPVKPSFNPPAGSEYIQTLSTDVAVTLNPNGSVKAALIYRSSGVTAWDDAVLNAAKSSTYLPKVVDCKPVESHYIFRANYPFD